MGMKVDVEFNGKWELTCIPMFCITTLEEGCGLGGGGGGGGDTMLPDGMVFTVTTLPPRPVCTTQMWEPQQWKILARL